MQDNQIPVTRQPDEWMLQVKELHLFIEAESERITHPVSTVKSDKADELLIPYKSLATYIRVFHKSFFGRVFCYLNRIKLNPNQVATKKLLLTSGLFDSQWYLERYPDVEILKQPALEHFILRGWREGRNPGPNFDTTFYLQSYPDVKQAGINPLEHYVKFGRSENRLPQSTKV